jgi:predicted kinase
MSTPSNQQRSVKIGDDERGGWSSDRPRRSSGPPRAPDISTRCRILNPSDTLRYNPGSLLLVVSPVAAERDRLIERTIESPGLVLSLDRIRGLLRGKTSDEEIEARAPELLENAVQKRLESGDSVVVPVEGLGPEARAAHLAAAARLRRPTHLIMVEAPRDAVADEDRAVLNELRTRLDAGELGAEGVQTALRLGGQAASEVKRIVFRPPPRDD